MDPPNETIQLQRFNPDETLVAMIASVLSIASLLHYFHSGELLLYGDAVAHINIARRVVDSLTPGPLQLGTVWLPLPHIITLPFVVSDWAWKTGVAGAVGSMLAYVAGTVGIFRLAKLFVSRAAAWIAVLVFAANPNLLYMQATGMTEPLFLATLVWSAFFFCAFIFEREHTPAKAATALVRCSIALSVAMLTRYDGWFLAGAMGMAVLFLFLRAEATRKRQLRRALVQFLSITALTPALWLGYNFIVYGNALEFLTGPYSAQAIQQKTARTMGSRHPGDHDLRAAKSFYIKAAKLNEGEGSWQHWLLIIAALAAFISVLQKRRRPALLLWLPLPFYTLSIAYGSVPIFIPEWWPHSYVNVRYGLQLLPAIAIFFALAVEMIRQVNYSTRTNRLGLVFEVVIVVFSYASVWIGVPICLREARVNSVARLAIESTVAAQLAKLPAHSRLMMFTGTHGGALQRAGIPFKRVLNEGNFPDWDKALKAPAAGGDYIVAIDADLVANGVARNNRDLKPIFEAKVEGEAIRLYESQVYGRQSKPTN